MILSLFILIENDSIETVHLFKNTREPPVLFFIISYQ